MIKFLLQSERIIFISLINQFNEEKLKYLVFLTFVRIFITFREDHYNDVSLIFYDVVRVHTYT